MRIRYIAAVEVQPMFPGGLDKFYDFLRKAVKYPPVDRENNVTGHKVYVQFVVEKDGSLTDIRALRGPSQSEMDEAVRAVKNLAKVEARYPKQSAGACNVYSAC